MRYFVYPGPSAERDFDRSQPGDIWEFKKTVAGEQFYIKKNDDRQETAATIWLAAFLRFFLRSANPLPFVSNKRPRPLPAAVS